MPVDQPILYKLWKTREFNFELFICSVCLSFFGMFMFGYHIHEKGILQVSIPLGMLLCSSPYFAKYHLLFSAVANYSLSPLFFTPFEMVIYFLFQLTYFLIELECIRSYWNEQCKISWFWKMYLIGLIAFELNRMFLFRLVIGSALPFVPLMLVSVYCFIGLFILYVNFYCHVCTAKSKID